MDGGHQAAWGFDPKSDRLHLHAVVLGLPDMEPDVLQGVARDFGLGRVDVEPIPSRRHGPVNDGFLAPYRRAEAARRVAWYVVFGPRNGMDFQLLHAETGSRERAFSAGGWPRG
jgi:hypothetical protein